MMISPKLCVPLFQHQIRLFARNKSKSVKIPKCKLYKLEKGPDTKTSINREDGLEMYNQMQKVRRMETKLSMMYKEKHIRGFCHLYSGQEAVAVGINAIRDSDDGLITAYRCHGFTHLFGQSIHKVMAEMCGKHTGCSKGLGGSMHMYADNFYGGNGIVGAQVPLGAGVALAMHYRKQKNVCFTLYGDGAANQGQVFEAFNIAKLWNLPCVFICENNKYGMGTSIERSSANTAYYTRGDYIPGLWVDGMNVLAVREAARFARDWCTSGKGPILLETETYRYHGHSMSDPGTSYRSREEVQEMRRDEDPITSFASILTENGLAKKDELKKIDADIRKKVDEAAKQVLEDPWPPSEEGFKYQFVEKPHNFQIRGCDLTIWYD